jgi:hypothetical protein
MGIAITEIAISLGVRSILTRAYWSRNAAQAQTSQRDHAGPDEIFPALALLFSGFAVLFLCC